MIATFYLGYNIYLISKYRKRTRYAEVFEEFNLGYYFIHSIDRISSITLNDACERFKNVCTSISDAFSAINGHHCGVCIKIVKEKATRPVVITFCRDQKSAQKRKVGSEDKIDHWLAENSDFNFIYKGLVDSNIDNHSYFANYLPWKYDYTNTRLINWPPKRLPLINLINRQIQWPLQYRSTIVVPLLPLSTNEHNKDALRGFLCLDSPRNNAFYKHIDVEILKGLADGLYNKIDKLYDIIKDENGRTV